MPECNRCGQCCHYFLNGIKKKCKFLVQISDKKTLCRIYSKKDRIGTEIDKGIFCNKIEDVIASGTSYTDCPYNAK